MSQSSGRHGADTNPYAAPHAELAEKEPSPPLASELLHGIGFRRSALRILGVVRAAGGIFQVVLPIRIVLAGASPLGLTLAAWGTFNLVAGWSLSRHKNWGRIASISECLLQMIGAILFMAMVEIREPIATTVQFVCLFLLVWSAAYIRVMVSPVTKKACDQSVSTASTSMRLTGSERLPSIVAEFGVLLFAVVGVFLSALGIIGTVRAILG